MNNSPSSRMVEGAHRPGPWRAVRWLADCWLIQSGERPEAVVNLAKADREADARLIAAAPELLEAVQALLYKYAGDGETEDGDMRAFNLARAAIARATEAA